jgi:hypothetical protein
MNPRLNALMADLLNGQPETADEEALQSAATRFDAYVRGRPWAEDDMRLVWTSPAARRMYLTARLTMKQELTRRWEAQGLERDLVLRAADSQSDEQVLSNAGITVRILRAPAMGAWLISLMFSADAAAMLPPGVKIRLTDSGGKVWIEGAPDQALGLDAYWEDEDQTPAERLRLHALRLEFC